MRTELSIEQMIDRVVAEQTIAQRTIATGRSIGTLQERCRALTQAIVLALDNTSARSFSTLKKHAIRAAVELWNVVPSPLGDGDAKTETIGTYRRTVNTCPPSCAHLINKECYTMRGNVKMHQQRASKSVEADLAAVAIGGAIASKTQGDLRLMIAGGWAQYGDVVGGSVDLEFARCVATILDVCGVDASRCWSYTHFPDPRDVRDLRDALNGTVTIWHSDGADGMGRSITVDSFDKHDRKKGEIYCPNQRTKKRAIKDNPKVSISDLYASGDIVTCRTCRLCLDDDRSGSVTDRRTIVFQMD